ncbi:D-malate degradation protein R [Leminorella grimontii]|nr:D-malate degradation protein R [Leminorella grimontii]
MALNQYPLPKDLQVLVEIVHSGSFSGAAERLGQTPAFVTKRIHILESALNTTLLNRSAHGIALTESGKRCYDHALNVLNHMQTLVDDVTPNENPPGRDDPYRLQLRFWPHAYCSGNYGTDAAIPRAANPL